MHSTPGYDTVIFDLDGTLLDTLGDLAASTNAALAAYGLPARTIGEVRQFVGNGVRRLMELAVPGGAQHPQFEAILAAFKAHYSAHCQDTTAPYPGVVEMLDALAARGFKLAIVSNKFDAAVKQLSAQYFGARLPVAIGEQEGVRKKPAPDSVLRALRELGASPLRAVYVGDSDVDVQTAQNAGLAGIAVSWGFRSEAQLREAGAQRIVPTPALLLAELGL